MASMPLILQRLLPYAPRFSFLRSPKEASQQALHPGWVQTDMGGGGAPLTAEASVRGLRAVLASVTPEDNGRLIHHDGRRAEHW